MFCHQAHAVAGRPVDCRVPDPEWPIDPMITTTTQNGRTLADLTTHAGTRRMRPTEVVSEADPLPGPSSLVLLMQRMELIDPFELRSDGGVGLEGD